MSIRKLTDQEFESIAFKLEAHHSIFYKLWEMGELLFDENIPTACVKFDKAGNYVSFHFNPDFWEEKTPYERLFIICHECLHVWLNHGIRTINTEQPQTVNTALDIVINHMLVDNFGFNRHKLKDNKDLCWIDTVFDDTTEIKKDQTFEYYYTKMIESGNYNEKKLVDIHDYLKDVDLEKIMNEIGEDLSDEEKNNISKILKKHKEPKTKKVGESSSDEWGDINVPNKIKINKAWFDLIKQWANKKYFTDFSSEQWLKTNRRLAFFETDSGSELLLPSDDDEYNFDENRVDMWLYLDVSGSCFNLRHDFFCASLTIPKDRIKMRTFCFDTKINEVNLSEHKLIMGGGTSFSIIENHIQTEMKLSKTKKHPVVFVFSDGYGDNVKPSQPKNWHWFLDNSYESNFSHVKSLTGGNCNYHSLETFK